MGGAAQWEGDAASGSSVHMCETWPDSHATRVVTTWVCVGVCVCAWAKGFSHGRFHHTQEMAHKQEAVSQEFIRRNIISSPEIGTDTRRTDRAETLLWTASSHDVRSAAV